MDQDRAAHLAWCKRRALEYLDRGDIANAITSMMSDLNKHPETTCSNTTLAMLGMLAVQQNDSAAARRFIEGFN